ncbi:MAG: hypothetical protein ACREJV_07530 [Candidatus Rokuibacteriota bacterium]
MERDLDGRLSVRTRLIPGPCLWCWEIVDALEGEVIESSWTGRWSGYASRQEAMSAGLTRLLEKTRGSRSSRTPGRTVVMPRRSTMSSARDDASSLEGLLRPRRCLLVVPRSKLELYRSLKRSFADNDRVEVVLDRRFAQRRAATTVHEPERRRAERRVRTATEAELRSGRWTLVPVSAPSDPPHARPA